MQTFLNTPFSIGTLTLPHRLIQGPLAGYSCAPFRQLFYRYTPPAYCVSEMISAHDAIHKHQPDSRYLYRAPEEKLLCYQLSGNEPQIVAQAAIRLQALGADLIDLNCGCPKAKIRKKGAGSALLEDPERLETIVRAVREAITIPFTVKIRLGDVGLAKTIEQAGADALVVHGRSWTQDYDQPCDFSQIAAIKRALTIPVIANGDISDHASLAKAVAITGCDAYMIGRAGSGNPWLYQQLLTHERDSIEHAERVFCFLTHLRSLANLESDHQAVLQSKSLIRYYFRNILTDSQLQFFYSLDSLKSIAVFANAV